MTLKVAPTPIPTCKTCGQQHITARGLPACTGHISGISRPDRKGEPCTRPAIRGQRVCRAHGGATKQARTKAAERVQMEQAEKTLRRFSAPSKVDNYGDELLDLICRVKGAIVYISHQLDQVEADDLVWGKTKDKVGGDDHGTTHEAKQNAWLALYDRWTEKYGRLLTDAVRIGLDERRVRLAEQQGELMMRVIDGALTELGHDPADPAVAGVVIRHLRLVDGESA